MPKPLAELMAEHNLGVVELARLARVTHAAISQILHGKQVPNLRTARRIASALGVGVDEILFPAESESNVATQAGVHQADAVASQATQEAKAA